MTIIQYDIFGNIVSQKLCKCGCGNPVYGDNDYINGHNTSSEIGKEEQSKRIIQYYIDHPEVRLKLSEIKKQQYIDRPELRNTLSKLKTQFYIDHPEAKVQQSDSARKITLQYNVDHPEIAEESSIRMIQFYIDHPEVAAAHGIYMQQYYINHPEVRERQSAIMKGEDYDKGEWTGFSLGKRLHVLPISRCLHLNKYFIGSSAHHITRSIIIFIPTELHWHIGHSLKSGRGMAEINMLALQFMNGEL